MTISTYTALSSQVTTTLADNATGAIMPAIARSMVQNTLDSYPPMWVGTSAPTGTPQTYQFWINTTANPSILNVYDGSQWLQLASINTSAHTLIVPYTALPYAPSADFLSNVANEVLITSGYWTAQAPVALTFSATVTVNMSQFINATLTLTGNATLGAPTGTKTGQTGNIEVFQDGTGSRTLAYAAGSYIFAGGTAPTLTTTANARDVLSYKVLSDSKVLITATLNVH